MNDKTNCSNCGEDLAMTCRCEDHYHAPKREEVGCKSLLAELLSVVCHDPECHTLHHTVREYRNAGERCPAKARYLTAIRKAQEFLG